jgi:hypothetical protein
MSAEYNPNYWQVVKITTPEKNLLYKVFATWIGGYTTGDSWKMNSGIVKVTKVDDMIEFHGYSGSVYKCINVEHLYRTTMYTHSVLESLMKKADVVGAKIEVLPFNTNFEELV